MIHLILMLLGGYLIVFFFYKLAKYNYNKFLNKFKNSDYTIAEFSDNIGNNGFIILKDKEKLSKHLNEIKPMAKIYNLEIILDAMNLFKTKESAQLSLNKLKIKLEKENYKEIIKPDNMIKSKRAHIQSNPTQLIKEYGKENAIKIAKVSSGYFTGLAINPMEQSFTSRLIFQIGDIIHYQAHDYEKTTPINASIYSLIGTLLRHLSKYSREHYTIEKLLTKSPSTKHLYSGNSEIFDNIKNFNAIMLVDLVSRMQGSLKDNNLKEEVLFIKQQYKIS